MSLSDQERAYYAAKFQEELDRIDRNDATIRSQTANSFLELLQDIVYRIAPHLWENMKDVWERIFFTWLHNTDRR